MSARIQKTTYDSVEGNYTTGENTVRLNNDKVKASKAELHFCFAFNYTGQSTSYQRLLRPTQNTRFKESTDQKQQEMDQILGNDGHLLFQRPLESAEISHVPAMHVTLGKQNGDAARTGTSQLPQPLTVDGQQLMLNQVMIRLYSHGIGILRFAIECSDNSQSSATGGGGVIQTKLNESLGRSSTVTNSGKQMYRLQTLLNVQNSVMRTVGGSSVKRLQVSEKGGFDFLPLAFIESILETVLGPKGLSWHADTRTDRLAVYTLAAIDANELSAMELKAITYKLGQMEDSASAPLDKQYLDDFYRDKVYSRFATPNGGIYTTFHIDGGATIYFTTGNNSETVPVLRAERIGTGRACFGTNRPLVAFSLIEPYLFHRIYLRMMDQSLNGLISEGRPTKKALESLKQTHLTNLQYKAMFLSKDISSTRAGKEQFNQHLEIGQLPQLYSSLSETISQMYSFFSAVEERQAQKRLDSLTLVFGVLGLAGLVLSFYSYYLSLDANAPDVHRIVPALIDVIMLLVAFIYLYQMRTE
jgi:hypothetical protein